MLGSSDVHSFHTINKNTEKTGVLDKDTTQKDSLLSAVSRHRPLLVIAGKEKLIRVAVQCPLLRSVSFAENASVPISEPPERSSDVHVKILDTNERLEKSPAQYCRSSTAILTENNAFGTNGTMKYRHVHSSAAAESLASASQTGKRRSHEPNKLAMPCYVSCRRKITLLGSAYRTLTSAPNATLSPFSKKAALLSTQTCGKEAPVCAATTAAKASASSSNFFNEPMRRALRSPSLTQKQYLNGGGGGGGGLTTTTATTTTATTTTTTAAGGGVSCTVQTFLGRQRGTLRQRKITHSVVSLESSPSRMARTRVKSTTAQCTASGTRMHSNGNLFRQSPSRVALGKMFRTASAPAYPRSSSAGKGPVVRTFSVAAELSRQKLQSTSLGSFLGVNQATWRNGASPMVRLATAEPTETREQTQVRTANIFRKQHTHNQSSMYTNTQTRTMARDSTPANNNYDPNPAKRTGTPKLNSGGFGNISPNAPVPILSGRRRIMTPDSRQSIPVNPKPKVQRQLQDIPKPQHPHPHPHPHQQKRQIDENKEKDPQRRTISQQKLLSIQRPVAWSTNKTVSRKVSSRRCYREQIQPEQKNLQEGVESLHGTSWKSLRQKLWRHDRVRVKRTAVAAEKCEDTENNASTEQRKSKLLSDSWKRILTFPRTYSLSLKASCKENSTLQPPPSSSSQQEQEQKQKHPSPSQSQQCGISADVCALTDCDMSFRRYQRSSESVTRVEYFRSKVFDSPYRGVPARLVNDAVESRECAYHTEVVRRKASISDFVSQKNKRMDKQSFSFKIDGSEEDIHNDASDDDNDDDDDDNDSVPWVSAVLRIKSKEGDTHRSISPVVYDDSVEYNNEHDYDDLRSPNSADTRGSSYSRSLSIRPTPLSTSTTSFTSPVPMPPIARNIFFGVSRSGPPILNDHEPLDENTEQTQKHVTAVRSPRGECAPGQYNATATPNENDGSKAKLKAEANSSVPSLTFCRTQSPRRLPHVGTPVGLPKHIGRSGKLSKNRRDRGAGALSSEKISAFHATSRGTAEKGDRADAICEQKRPSPKNRIKNLNSHAMGKRGLCDSRVAGPMHKLAANNVCGSKLTNKPRTASANGAEKRIGIVGAVKSPAR